MSTPNEKIADNERQRAHKPITAAPGDLERAQAREELADSAQARKLARRLYNLGYCSGHHDTVEGVYVDLYQQDLESFHEEEVDEIVLYFAQDLAKVTSDADPRL